MELLFKTVCVVVVVALLGLCFDYSLNFYFGKDIAWYHDLWAGILSSAVTVPATVIAIVLELCGVSGPLFGV